MWMVDDVEIRKVGERFRSARRTDVASRRVPAYDLRYLDCEKVRGVDGLVIGREPRRHLAGQRQV